MAGLLGKPLTALHPLAPTGGPDPTCTAMRLMSVVSVPLAQMAPAELRRPAMPYTMKVNTKLLTSWKGSVAVTCTHGQACAEGLK